MQRQIRASGNSFVFQNAAAKSGDLPGKDANTALRPGSMAHTTRGNISLSQASQSANTYHSSTARRASDAPALCSVVYRSRAVSALSDYDLYSLVQAAQTRNARDSITGLMLYDEGRFYQWLEGPAENVARLMQSIAADQRHTDIEILSDKPAAVRQFGDWKMRLATSGVRSIHSIHNVVVPSSRALDDIRQHPDHG